MATMRTLYCQNGDHYWQRPSQRGPQPFHCPEHSSKAEPTASQDAAEPTPVSEPQDEERGPFVHGRAADGSIVMNFEKPRPEATTSPRRSAESSPLWQYISKLKAEYHCTCDIHPGMTLADLRQVKSCQPGWICNVLDAYRRRLAS